MEVQRRQLQIEVDQAEQQRDAQIDEDPGESVSDGLAFLLGLLGSGRRRVGLSLRPLLKGIGVEAAKIELKWHKNAPFFSYSGSAVPLIVYETPLLYVCN